MKDSRWRRAFIKSSCGRVLKLARGMRDGKTRPHLCRCTYGTPWLAQSESDSSGQAATADSVPSMLEAHSHEGSACADMKVLLRTATRARNTQRSAKVRVLVSCCEVLTTFIVSVCPPLGRGLCTSGSTPTAQTECFRATSQGESLTRITV